MEQISYGFILTEAPLQNPMHMQKDQLHGFVFNRYERHET
jgi:hypothetical protein